MNTLATATPAVSTKKTASRTSAARTARKVTPKPLPVPRQPSTRRHLAELIDLLRTAESDGQHLNPVQRAVAAALGMATGTRVASDDLIGRVTRWAVCVEAEREAMRITMDPGTVDMARLALGDAQRRGVLPADYTLEAFLADGAYERGYLLLHGMLGMELDGIHFGRSADNSAGHLLLGGW